MPYRIAYVGQNPGTESARTYSIDIPGCSHATPIGEGAVHAALCAGPHRPHTSQPEPVLNPVHRETTSSATGSSVPGHVQHHTGSDAGVARVRTCQYSSSGTTSNAVRSNNKCPSGGSP